MSPPKVNYIWLREHFAAVTAACGGGSGNGGSDDDDTGAHGMISLATMTRAKKWRFDLVCAAQSDADHLASRAGIAAQAGDCYHGINLISPDAAQKIRVEHRRGTEAELSHVLAIGMDADAGDKPGHHYPPQRVLLDATESMPLQPSLVYLSGRPDGGLHVWWLLATPHPIGDPASRVWAKDVSRGWHAMLRLRLGEHELDSTWDLSRVLRPAGSVNHRYGTVVTPIITEPGRRYGIEQIAALIPAEMMPGEPSHSQPVQPGATATTPAPAIARAARRPSGTPAVISTADAIEQARRYVAGIPGAVSGQHGHDRTYRTACVLTIGFGLGIVDALPLLEMWNQTCSPPWESRDLVRKLEQASKQPGLRGGLIRSPAAAAIPTAIPSADTADPTADGLAAAIRRYVHPSLWGRSISPHHSSVGGGWFVHVSAV